MRSAAKDRAEVRENEGGVCESFRAAGEGEVHIGHKTSRKIRSEVTRHWATKNRIRERETGQVRHEKSPYR